MCSGWLRDAWLDAGWLGERAPDYHFESVRAHRCVYIVCVYVCMCEVRGEREREREREKTGIPRPHQSRCRVDRHITPSARHQSSFPAQGGLSWLSGRIFRSESCDRSALLAQDLGLQENVVKARKHKKNNSLCMAHREREEEMGGGGESRVMGSWFSMLFVIIVGCLCVDDIHEWVLCEWMVVRGYL